MWFALTSLLPADGGGMYKLFHSPMTFDHQAFTTEVYDIVSQIPAGRVLSYGRVAELAGWPNHARAVGRAMKEVPLELGLPCHRVVTTDGRTVPGWHQQAILLMSEGIRLKENGCVDMRRFMWVP